MFSPAVEYVTPVALIRSKGDEPSLP